MCISYLKMKRARELAYLQSKSVTCISYLKIEKERVLLKSRECLYSRRDARKARRGNVPDQTPTSLFQLEEYEFKLQPGSRH